MYIQKNYNIETNCGFFRQCLIIYNMFEKIPTSYRSRGLMDRTHMEHLSPDPTPAFIPIGWSGYLTIKEVYYKHKNIKSHAEAQK
jgi:hypothetical protein